MLTRPAFVVPSSQAPPPRRPRPPARSSSSSRTSSRTPRQPSRPTRRTNRCWANEPSSRTSSSACKPTAPTSTDSGQRFRMHLLDTCSGWYSSWIKTSSTTRFTFGKTPWECGSRARGRAWTTSVARWSSRTDRRPFARMTAANLGLRCVFFISVWAIRYLTSCFFFRFGRRRWGAREHSATAWATSPSPFRTAYG